MGGMDTKLLPLPVEHLFGSVVYVVYAIMQVLLA